MIDTSKKSNIKCEHCDCWNGYKCHNEYSPKWNTQVNYWNRCKEFDWNERIKQEIKMRAFAINEFEKLKAEIDKLEMFYLYSNDDLISKKEVFEIIDNRIKEPKGE